MVYQILVVSFQCCIVNFFGPCKILKRLLDEATIAENGMAASTNHLFPNDSVLLGYPEDFQPKRQSTARVRQTEQGAAFCEALLALAVGQEAAEADAVEARW